MRSRPSKVSCIMLAANSLSAAIAADAKHYGRTALRKRLATQRPFRTGASLPLLLKLYPASLPPTSKKQKKAAKQESFQQNGYAKSWVKPLRQAQVEREQSIRHSKSGPSRSHPHAAAILAFLPIFLPHRMVWLPKPSKKSNSTEKSISAIGAAVRTDREIEGLYAKPSGTIEGTLHIPSHSNAPSYRQQARALFRYISSSRFSCGYFGMHSYIFTSICTAAREGFSAFAPYRARHCPIRNSYILALLAQHFPILTSYPQFHLSIPMNMDFLSSSHAHSRLLLMRTPTSLHTFHINTQSGPFLVAPFAVDLDFIPMKKQKIPINDENS